MSQDDWYLEFELLRAQERELAITARDLLLAGDEKEAAVAARRSYELGEQAEAILEKVRERRGDHYQRTTPQ
jgi:hypothetical protein